MEKLSTPIAVPLVSDVNRPMVNSNIEENENITFKNNLSASNPLSFGNISPIDFSKSIYRGSTAIAKPDHQKDDSDNTLVNNDPLRDDESLAEVDSLTGSSKFDNESLSDCYIGSDTLATEDVGVEDVKEAILEMSQAAHKYIDKIKHLGISVQWELPETMIADKGLRKSANGSKGPLEPEEISFFKKRLRQFCKEYNINCAEIRACLAEKVTKFRFPNELRLKFLQYLCKDYVNDRNPSTVLRAVTKLGIRKGKFSEDEENFLIDMYHKYKGSYFHSVCGLILNRHRTHILRKIERMKKKKLLGSRPSNRINSKSMKLRSFILNDIMNRKNFNLDSLRCRINRRSWLSIGREYNVSPALAKGIFICELLPQLCAVHPVKFHRFFVKMIYRIKRSDWETWEDVKWTQLSTTLYDVGPAFVYIMLRKIIMACVPKEKWGSFKDCAEFLHQNVLPYFENKHNKVTLNRIIIEHNENGH